MLIEHHGEEAQLRQTIEELAELIVEISHYQRGRISVLGLRDEIADVEIMLEQLIYLVDAEDPDAMDRTRRRKRAKAVASVTGLIR
jgi:NTP pyrophosphatase (non-canonical NTP hydrolase)